MNATRVVIIQVCTLAVVAIAGQFSRAIVRIQPGSFEHVRVAESPVPSFGGLVLTGGRGYFASGSRIWSCPVPAS